MPGYQDDLNPHIQPQECGDRRYKATVANTALALQVTIARCLKTAGVPYPCVDDQAPTRSAMLSVWGPVGVSGSLQAGKYVNLRLGATC